MRIGVRPSGIAARYGGAFTFEREVLDRLLSLAEESQHEFVLLDPPADLASASLPPCVTVACPPELPSCRIRCTGPESCSGKTLDCADASVCRDCPYSSSTGRTGRSL